jgi:hypothetical protein
VAGGVGEMRMTFSGGAVLLDQARLSSHEKVLQAIKFEAVFPVQLRLSLFANILPLVAARFRGTHTRLNQIRNCGELIDLLTHTDRRCSLDPIR